MRTKEREKIEAKEEAIKTLRKMGVKPGKRVYTSVSHVARSGMSRRINVYIPTRNTYDGKTEQAVTDITGLVAHALGYRRHKDGGLVVGGCGMDMGFAVVYNLGRAMFPKGAPRFVSRGREVQEQQAAKREGREPRGEYDGGYLLKQEWL
jgi:hypothetical protein